MHILIGILKIVFLLGFLIFIHEGGHFLVAKKSGVKVEAFSIGFGYKIFKKKYKDTEYSIGCIPIGGYVSMLGENEKSDDLRAFGNMSVLKRIAIVIAGPLVNIIFAIIVYFLLSVFSGYNISNVIADIIPEATENLSQLEIGDKIVKINDRNIRIKSDIRKELSNSKGENVEVTVVRDDNQYVYSIKPYEYEGSYYLGIIGKIGNETILNRLYYSFWGTVDFSTSVVDSFKMLVTQKDVVKQMTGPIGISEMVIDSNGIYNYIYLLALVSLSLGVTNLLPIPALDGGRLVLLVIEEIRGKALKEEIELGIQTVGFLILILFSVYVSYNDILRIF